MQYSTLGDSGMNVSTICMGCWAIGDAGWWGSQDQRDSVDAVRASLDAGVNFFDTAPAYQQSEKVLGEALQGRRDAVIIATKLGRGRLRPEEVRKACAESLEQLGTDHIDLYQIHWPHPKVPIRETMDALRELKQEGLIRAIGVSNFGIQDLSAVLEVEGIVSNQMAYSLLFRSIEHGIQPCCLKKNVGILAYSPLYQGLLTGKYATADEVPAGRARTRIFSKDRPGSRHDESGCEREAFEAIAAIRKIADDVDLPMGILSLAWVLAQPAVVSVIVGARNAGQVAQNVRAVDVCLTEDVLERLKAVTDPVKRALGVNPDMWMSGEKCRIR